jgi:O-antigen chain-terminating methyltransferase
MTLVELKAMIEAEALVRKAARDGFTLDAVKSYLGQAMAPPPGARGAVAPAPQPLTFRYFSDLHGRDFVDACYATLLGRGPDPDGLAHCLHSLARGEEKAFIVGRIAYSAEGRQRAVAVQGLRPRYLIAAAKKVPIAGTILAWIAALLGVHRQQRHQRAFEHHVATQIEALGNYTAQSGEQVARRIDALRAVLESRD